MASKTILVVYTDRKITQKAEITKMKKYSFNTEADVKVGDMLSSSAYSTNLQVVRVTESAFKYHNPATGEMSNSFNSSNQSEIKNLIIREDDEDTVYASIVE